MITKTQLLGFIDGFNGEDISKQDILNFIARSAVTELELADSKITVNGRDELHFMYFSSGGKAKLDELTLGQRVVVTFNCPDEDDIAPFVNYFIGKGYKVGSSINNSEVVFVNGQ